MVVSSWSPPKIGGPQNLYNLFSLLPKESYSVLTSYYGIDNYSAQNGTWLPGKYYFYDNTAFMDSPQNRLTINKESKGRSRLSWLKYKAKKIYFLRLVLGPFLIFGQIIVIIKQGVRIIKKDRSETILGISDFGPAMISSYFIHIITKKPLNLYLFDIYRGNALIAPGKFLARIFEPRLFKSSEKIIVTNDGTKEFYVRRYGEKIASKITVIYNSVFPDPYAELQKDSLPYDPKPPYTILFTGSIYWPQIRSIKNLIRAVEEITDLDIKLKIYSPSPSAYLKEIGIEESKKVKIMVAPPQDMPSIQNQADILFLPLSWKTQSQAIIDTATPGKLTDYLIAGKPILIHAPASTFLVKYARENDFAEIVDEENTEKLKTAIKKIITDRKFSEKIIRNAKKTFLKNHNAHMNFEIFKYVFLR